MSSGSRLRSLMALVFAISSLAVVAAPAAAETVLASCSGTCGYYEVKDQWPDGPAGGVCKFERGPNYDLDLMSARPPLMHGYYSFKTKVKWRFKVRHASPNGSTAFSTIYTSSYQSALANNATPAYAGHGFARRYWYAPENPVGDFKLWIEMQWMNNGQVEGFVRLEYDVYKKLSAGSSRFVADLCEDAD